MKQLYLTLAVLLLLHGFLLPVASGKTVPERLAVLDLEAKWGVEDRFAEALSVIVRDEIHRQGKYSVLSQADLRAVMTRDQILQAMGACDDSSACLNDFGKVLGSRFMVAGAVAKIGQTWTVSLRLLDTFGKNAGVVNRMSESRQCNENELIDMVKEVAAHLIGGKSAVSSGGDGQDSAKLIAEHRRKERGEAGSRSLRTRFTVETTPANARVQIINIQEKYIPGMELKPGKYLVDVTADGYRELEKWVEIPAGDAAYSVKISLEPVQSSIRNGYTDPVTGMEFVHVPQGCFVMGDSRGEGDEDEHPAHEVCLSEFWIGKYEVTQGQWKMVMGENPSLFQRGEKYPVESVSWTDVQNFIAKLNGISGSHFRLPTEAEWEYAAREGGRDVRFGNGRDTIDADSANYNAKTGRPETYSIPGEYRKRTVPVGSFAPNSLGIHDMAGNVWEWCLDWHSESYYGSSPKSNPMGPANGHDRVDRGGGWNSDPSYLRATNRSEATPGLANSFLGFRLVLPKKISNIENY